MPRSKTGDVAIKAARRRALAIKYRLSGKTLEETAALVRSDLGDECPDGYNRAWVHRDLSRELERLASERIDDLTQLREVQNARLDALLAACWSTAMAGNLAAIRTAADLVERQARLYGLMTAKLALKLEPPDFDEQKWIDNREHRLAAAMQLLNLAPGTEP